jgi:hypothetical protein
MDEGVDMPILKTHLLRNWKKIRAQGQIRFVIIYGMLIWGGSTALGAGLLIWLFAPTVKLATFSALSLGIFPLSGVLLGMSIWRDCERDPSTDEQLEQHTS